MRVACESRSNIVNTAGSDRLPRDVTMSSVTSPSSKADDILSVGIVSTSYGLASFQAIYRCIAYIGPFNSYTSIWPI